MCFNLFFSFCHEPQFSENPRPCAVASPRCLPLDLLSFRISSTYACSFAFASPLSLFSTPLSCPTSTYLSPRFSSIFRTCGLVVSSLRLSQRGNIHAFAGLLTDLRSISGLPTELTGFKHPILLPLQCYLGHLLHGGQSCHGELGHRHSLLRCSHHQVCMRGSHTIVR